jgi:hypothetical protein
MGLREKFQKRIDEKRQEISSLQNRIRDLKVYVQAVEDTMRLLPRENQERSGDLRSGTNIHKAYEALCERGEPMHIGEIVKAIGKSDEHDNRVALGGSISAYVRKGQLFTRPAPNTFGLLEFPRKPSAEVPPPNFGAEEPDELDGSDAEVEAVEEDDVPW